MEKVNITELLKDCPTGMELDSTLFEGLEFDCIVDNEYLPIRCRIKHPNGGYTVYNFTKYGCWLDTTFAKCVIFPKGKTTWEGFQRPFRDGDVVVCEENKEITQMFILKSQINNMRGYFYTGYDFKHNDFFEEGNWYFDRLATEEEKQKLFDAIKANGYKWNAETKTLEKLIEPKFKVGDKVKRKDDNYTYIVTIAKLDGDYYDYVNKDGQCGVIHVSIQDTWELVPIIPKFKVGDRITNGKYSLTISHIDDGCYYEIKKEVANRLSIKNQDDWRLDKFDITTLKAFESRVLVRYDKDNKWCGAFFAHIDKEHHTHCYKYVTTAGKSYPYCIPYKGNEYLLNTTDDCSNYYKTWE